MTLAERFLALFRSCDNAYGTYRVDKARTRDGKKEGQAVTHKKTLTTAHIERHLTGKTGIGLIPITTDNLSYWGAVDVDIYDIDVPEVAKRVAAAGYPMVVCRTKSGGVHLNLFLKEGAEPKALREKLGAIASALGYGGCEIFPKQDFIDWDKGDTGNWLNMPYYDAEQTTRYALHPETGEAMELAEFLDHAEGLKTSLEEIEVKVKEARDTSDEFEAGPPCLQVLSKIGYGDGHRNQGLFNIGVYLKKRYPSDWDQRIVLYNHKFMDPPLGSAEVATITTSIQRKDYSYRCKEEPIASHCDKNRCITQRYGVGPSVPSIVSLTQYPFEKGTRWDVELEGLGRVRQLSTNDMMDPNRFRMRAAEQLKIMFPRFKQVVWDGMLADAFDTTIEVEDWATESGDEGIFLDCVSDFMATATQHDTIDDVLLGAAVESEGRIFFRFTDLVTFLRQNGFRDYTNNDISAKLIQHHDAKRHKERLKGRQARLWSMAKPDELEDLEPPNMGEDVV